MIELRNLSVGYGRKAVLSGLNARLEPGTVTALLGVNGCGKSTLLKTLDGLAPPLAGQALLAGREQLTAGERAKLAAYLPQSRDVPAISALRLVLHGRFPHLSVPRRYRDEDWRIARESLAEVGMEAWADAELTRLSGGQRQKVYLAMLLAQRTPIALLDEPTTYLDVACQLDTWALCRRMAQGGKTVALATHDLQQAVRYADQLLVLGGGGLLRAGTPKEILDSHVLESAFSVSITRCGDRITAIEQKEDME